jgi:hypothetical protein
MNQLTNIPVNSGDYIGARQAKARVVVMKTLTMFAVTLCLLGGCSSSQTMTAQDRQSIKTIAISSQVKKRDTMDYQGPGQWGNEQASLVASVFGQGAAGKPIGEDLQLQALSSSIYIDKIVRESLATALRTENKYTLVPEGTPGAYVMAIEVNLYGFGAPGVLSSTVVPMIKVTCSIGEPTGRIIWRASGQLLNLYNPVQAQKPEDLYLNPQLIEKSWREASEIIATKIVKKL